MRVYLDLDTDEAMDLRRRLAASTSDIAMPALRDDLIAALDAAIESEDERSYDRQQERLMESGGPDDSAYRQQLKDAGRGHLLR